MTFRRILLTIFFLNTQIALGEQRFPEAPEEPYNPACKQLKIPRKHGPYDYRSATSDERDLVERYHFTEQYTAYRSGKKIFQKKVDNIYETPESGFGYTLWAFPNHPLALSAVEDISFRRKQDDIGIEVSTHCWFQRAVKFVPNDGNIRLLYAYYYARRGKKQEAITQLTQAEDLLGETMNLMTYAAWVYLEIGDLAKATAYADKAYQAGYTLPGLRTHIDSARKNTQRKN